MNYLAHAYLSFNQPQLVVGNMISDFVKGKTKFDYPPGIQNGIALHRAIDEFTDAHPVTKQAKEFFRPAYRLYAGAFVDVVYDHFLALDRNEFTDAQELRSFTLNTYHILDENFLILPLRFHNIFPHMKLHNWLYNYQYLTGIQKSFGGLVHRAAFMNESATAFTILNENLDSLRDCYESFFPSLKKFAALYVQDLPLT